MDSNQLGACQEETECQTSLTLSESSWEVEAALAEVAACQEEDLAEEAELEEKEEEDRGLA